MFERILFVIIKSRGMFERISINPNQMGGVPCIRNLRIPVATIISMVAEGITNEEILNSYPDLEIRDITVALLFASEAVRERYLPLLAS